jgi:hypothetical protein
MDFAEGLGFAVEVLIGGFLLFAAIAITMTLREKYLFCKYKKARQKYQLTIQKEKDDAES